MRHLVPRRCRHGSSRVDLGAAFEVVAEKIRVAALVTSHALTSAGIRHAIIGGLAVGAYGHPRGTKDVDFLVGEEALVEHAGGLVTLHPAVPITVGGVEIHVISSENRPDLEQVLDNPVPSAGVPVVPVETLVYLKLDAFRSQDKTDVIRLVQAGLDVCTTRQYLEVNAPELVGKLDLLVAEAEAETARR